MMQPQIERQLYIMTVLYVYDRTFGRKQACRTIEAEDLLEERSEKARRIFLTFWLVMLALSKVIVQAQ